MKSTFFFALQGLTVFSALSAVGQGIFQNLNFESARIIPVVDSPYYPYGVATSNALPGWTVSYGGSLQSEVTYNAPALGSTWVNLWATNTHVVEGNFSVLLQGGLTATDASISQTGVVPANAQSIQFKAQAGNGTLLVSLGGQNIPFFALASGANYTLYGGDVSAFAGQTDQLEFSALEDLSVPNNWNIDSIVFSTSPVPEPGECAVILCGAAVFGVTRWRKRYASSKFKV